MKRTITLLLLAAATITGMAQQPWQDASLSFHERAKLIVQQMTLSEKINQVGHGTFGISRLGLNGYYYWNEGLHGVARSGPATSFPVSKAMSATWDEQLIFDCASATADEARVYNNVYGKGLIYWCPTINMSRDPRWGRDEENYGEDPFLTGRIAVAYIKGMQGDDPKYYKTVATVKHFVANNYEGGRHHTSSNMDERDLREYYLPAYERSVKEGHVRAIMPGYNAVNGVPACCNRKLLKDILRTEWGFDGCVTSDCDALDDIYLAHKYVATGVRAAAISMRNGCDLNCGCTFQAHCEEAIDQGLLTVEELDSALVRVLESRFSVGEFDGPDLVRWQLTPDSLLNCHRNRQLALQAAREAIVLLKNSPAAEGQQPLLPLRRDQTVCVIGPLARTITLGGYSGSPVYRTTVLQGIAGKMGVSPRGRNLEFEDVDSMKPCGPGHLLFEANGADGNLGFINNGDWVMFRDVDFGEGKTRLTLRSASPNSNAMRVSVCLDERTSAAVLRVELQPTGSYGKYDEQTFDIDPTVFKGKHRVFFKFNFSGAEHGANMDWCRFWNEGDGDPLQADGPLFYARGCNVNDGGATNYDEACQMAAKADVVVLCVGTDLGTCDETRDRASLSLPGDQQRLLQKVMEVNPNVVLCLQSCSSLTINWAQAHVPAIIEAWYGGQAQGEAIADVLYGDYNPAGRLSTTWYNSVYDLPQDMLQYDIRKNHYTYLYYNKTPLYPFGYGLSYTTFSYANLTLSSTELRAGGETEVSFDVTNTGSCDGDEVVQLYVTCTTDGIDRPQKELKGFARVHLKAGETRRVTLPLRHEELCYFNTSTNTYDVSPGTVQVMVGGSSADIRLRGEVEAEGATVKYTYKSMPAAIATPVSAGSADGEMLYDLGGKSASKGLLVGKGKKVIK